MREKKDYKRQACYFKSLDIKNIACFRSQQSLNLADKEGRPVRWTVIIGDNGLGKTTLLRCLALLFPYGGKNREDRTFVTPRLFWEIARGETDARIHAKFGIGPTFAEEGKKVLEKERKLILKSKQLYPSSEEEWQQDVFICHGYGATRRLGQSTISGDDKRFPAINLFDDDKPLLNSEEWLLKADYKAAKDGKFSNYKIQVENIIRKLLPDIRQIEYDVNERNPRVLFHTFSGKVGTHQLSLGYRAMLAWLIDFIDGLYEHYPESENPMEESAVLLLDEIDLHLHLGWQRKLIGLLSSWFPNTQFITTAHSPLIVLAAEDANLVLLKRRSNDVAIKEAPFSIQNYRLDQLVTSDLYGLESARQPRTQELLDEKHRILSKDEISPKDEHRLNDINLKLEGIPLGETPAEIEADFLLKQLAKNFRTNTAEE